MELKAPANFLKGDVVKQHVDLPFSGFTVADVFDAGSGRVDVVFLDNDLMQTFTLDGGALYEMEESNDGSTNPSE